MSKSRLLSFYDKSNSPKAIDGTFIKDVMVDEVTQMVSIRFSNDTTQDVGVAAADPARSVVGATIQNHNLVILFDNNDEEIIGRIDPTTVRIIPTLVGKGILTNAAAGTYKEIKSGDPAIVVTETPTELRVDVTLPGGQIVAAEPDNSINPHLALVLKDEVTGTGLVGRVAPGVGWHARTFTSVQTVGSIGASFSGTQLTLTQGTWYVDGLHSSNRATNGKAAIKDSEGNVVLESLPKRQTTVDDTIMTYRVSGYITVEAASQTFTIEQYASAVGTVGGLGATYLGGEFGSSRPVTEYNIYKVSNTPVALSKTFTEDNTGEPSIVTALKTMAATYADRTPTPVKIFNEFPYADNAGWNFSGSCTVGTNVYFGPADSPYLLEWDTVTGNKKYYPIAPPTSTFFSHCMVPAEGKIYIIPSTGVWVGIFDVATKQTTWTNFGITIPTTADKWASGAYDPVSRKIFCLPNASVGTLIIDVAAQTATITTFGLTYLSTGNYFSTVVVGGFVYGIPLDATNILVVDIAAGTAVQTTMGATLTGTGKWTGAVYDSLTNKIVSNAYTATDCLVIDIATQTAIRSSFGLSLSGTAKFEFGITGTGDGKAYMFPRTRANGQGAKVDLVTMTGAEIPIPWRDSMSFVKSALCNGKIYLMPIGNSTLAVYDIADNSVVPQISNRTTVVAGSSSYRWNAATLGGDGTIFPVPANVYDLYSLNLENLWCVKFPFPLDVASTAGGYSDGVRDGDGNVVMVPQANADGIKMIAPVPGLGTPRKKHFKNHISLVPELSGFTGPGVTVSASAFQVGYEPWKAFNGLIGSSNGATNSWASTSGVDPRIVPVWIQVQFDTPMRVDVVRLRCVLTANQITRISIQASNNGSDFVELARRSPNFRAQYSMMGDLVLDNDLEFTHYRLVVLESSADGAVTLNEIQLLQYDANEPDYYEVHAAQQTATSAFLTISQSSASHATSYARQNVLRDWSYAEISTSNTWISADNTAEQWLEFRTLLPIKATALRIVNGWSYFTQTVRIEASNNGRDYVVLLPNTAVNNAIIGSGEKNQFKPVPIITFANNQEYLSYRVVFVTRTIPTNAQKNAGAMMVKLLSTEPYDPRNLFGRPEQVFGIYGQAGTAKWKGGIYAPENGKIYFGRSDHANYTFGIYDTKLDEFSASRFRENMSYTTGEAIGTVRKNPYDDSYIFAPWHSATDIVRLRFNAVGEEYVDFIPLTKDYIPASSNVGGGVLAPNGMYYSISRAGAAVWHVLDLKYLTSHTEFFTGTVGGSTNVGQGGVGPNGKLYFTPFTGNTFIEYDPETMATTTFTHLTTTTSAHLARAKLTRSGKLFLESLTGGAAFNGFFYLDFGPGITIPDEILFSPHINN